MAYYIKFDGITGTSGNSAYIGYCKVFQSDDEGDGTLSFRMSFSQGSGPLMSASMTGDTIASALMVQDEDGSILMKTRYTSLNVTSGHMSKKGNSFEMTYGGSTTDYPQWSSD
jgi:hypothetical protein